MTPSPLDHYAPELNLLEHRALAFLKSRTQTDRKPPLDDRARAKLKAISWRATIWAALSGTLSGLIIGGVETYLRLVVIDDDQSGMLDHPGIWASFYLFVGALTVVEIGFLYWVALSFISRMREVVGIAIDRDSASDLVKTGLARSAMEIPNPHNSIYGVDPYMMMPRWRLLVWNLLYKAKVGATSVLLRVFMRRVLSRAVLRGYIPLLAIPLYAGWNAFIIWRVMQEARLRALGPFGVQQALSSIADQNDDGRFALTALRCASQLITRSGDAHPNYVLLLSYMLEQSRIEEGQININTGHFWNEVAQLEADKRRAIAQFAMIVAVLAGRPNRAQVQFLSDLHDKTGLTFDAARPAQFSHLILDGRPLPSP